MDWQPSLTSKADGSRGHAVGEEDVSDDVPPHQSLPLLLASEEGGDQDGHAVRPGQERVLPPPSRHDQGDVEAEDEGEGYGGELVVAVGHQALKQLSRLLPLNRKLGQVCCKIKALKIWEFAGAKSRRQHRNLRH